MVQLMVAVETAAKSSATSFNFYYSCVLHETKLTCPIAAGMQCFLVVLVVFEGVDVVRGNSVVIVVGS